MAISMKSSGNRYTTVNKASQNRQQAGWTRKPAFAGRRYVFMRIDFIL